MRIVVHGRAAHSSTPWLGDNAVLKADRRVPRDRDRCRSAASPRRCSTGRRSTSGGSRAATRSTRFPTSATMAVDVRYLPGQDPAEILAQVRKIPDIDVTRTFIHPPVDGLAAEPLRAARCATPSRGRSRGEVHERRARRRLRRRGVHRGRHPGGGVRPGWAAGHHGPDEWVSVASLAALPPARWPTSCARCPTGWRGPRAARATAPPAGDRGRPGVSGCFAAGAAAALAGRFAARWRCSITAFDRRDHRGGGSARRSSRPRQRHLVQQPAIEIHSDSRSRRPARRRRCC